MSLKSPPSFPGPFLCGKWCVASDLWHLALMAGPLPNPFSGLCYLHPPAEAAGLRVGDVTCTASYWLA